MSEALTFKSANLPAPTALAQSLRKLEVEVSQGGRTILKMDKTGHWVYGADQTEITDDSTWAINPFSFTHGYIAWGDGEVLGEKMVPIYEPLPELDPAPAGAKKGWESQLGIQVRCMSGDDEGVEAHYCVTSVGGKKVLQAIALDIAAQVEKDQTNPVPVVTLGKEHYQHKSYGRIYTPVFQVVDWIGMDGKAEEAAESVPEAQEAAAETTTDTGVRRRRRSI